MGGCGKAMDARGWCTTHYGRWRRTGTPLPAGTLIPWAPTLGPCIVTGCTTTQNVRGWCDRHYRRWCDTGDTGDTGDPTTPRP